jgi:RNA polymerase II subunit A small phosphatase-like protein
MQGGIATPPRTLLVLDLDAFLAACTRWYDLAVWSSASDPYVEAVVAEIFPDPSILHFVWGRSRATLPRFHRPDDSPWHFDHRSYRKPLAKAKKRGWRTEARAASSPPS